MNKIIIFFIILLAASCFALEQNTAEQMVNDYYSAIVSEDEVKLNELIFFLDLETNELFLEKENLNNYQLNFQFFYPIGDDTYLLDYNLKSSTLDQNMTAALMEKSGETKIIFIGTAELLNKIAFDMPSLAETNDQNNITPTNAVSDVKEIEPTVPETKTTKPPSTKTDKSEEKEETKTKEDECSSELLGILIGIGAIGFIVRR